VTPLPWQEGAARTLEALLASDRLPHALLIAGQAGWGEGVLANWLALHILGVDESGDAETLAHPDLRWVRPDGAMIKIDAIRELAEFAQGTPQSGSRKVAVLVDAHAMNRNAANALLKTLEEPPPGTHLVLVSCRPAQLLPTVRSRCQRINLQTDSGAARAWLAARLEVPDLEQRLFEHGGAPVAIADGCAAGELPLRPLLQAALDGAEVGGIAQQLVAQGLAGATARWLRYLHALLSSETSFPAFAQTPARALARFGDELAWVRGQLLVSNSVNERLMAERLLVLWRGLANS
jgi:DNA polymerase III subunit delta'